MRPKTRPGVVLQPGDAGGGAVHVLAVEQRGVAVLHIFVCVAFLADEAAFGVGDGQFKIVGQRAEVGAGVAVFLQRCPAADEASAGVVDQAAAREKLELREDLEAVADAERHSRRRSTNFFKRSPSLLFVMSCAMRPAHDVVAVAEAAGEDDHLRAVERRRFEQRDGQDFSGETSGFESAGGFSIAIGAGEFEEECVGHDKQVCSGWRSVRVMQQHKMAPSTDLDRGKGRQYRMTG